ncbi:hypothetical protein [Sphaerisporangium aureirubrum]|uniref:Tn3 transposase DDE domain-containing protein n=1 Tax=Sphaerisporangium aureirubrum TaxID=1544736 RepID=A0ABW1NT01_9ACTN
MPGLVGMIFANQCVDDEAGQLIPLKAALRGAYPEHTRARFYGTHNQVDKVDALKFVIDAHNRRVDLVDPARSAPGGYSSLGLSIEQDAEDKSDDDENQEYYHVGAGSAWTTRIHTCTALTGPARFELSVYPKTGHLPDWSVICRTARSPRTPITCGISRPKSPMRSRRPSGTTPRALS